MNRNEWSLAREVAVNAATKAGELARERFGGKLTIQHKDDRGDLVTEVDVQADRLIVEDILAVFPSHRIYSEEAGEGGTVSDWVWHVDPLDGTNNFALGMPLYGVCISLSYQGQIVLGVIRDSALGLNYVAVKDEGAWQEDVKFEAKPKGPLAKSTISWIQGHGVGKDDHKALGLRHHLEHSIKRVLRMWAPSLTWAMLARGDLHGVVLYNSEGEDLYAGLLIAQEAGVKVTDFAGNPIAMLGGAGASASAGVSSGASAGINAGVSAGTSASASTSASTSTSADENAGKSVSFEVGIEMGQAVYLVAAVPEYHAELLAIVQEAIRVE
ncbi:inositol monophosphatase family protein [Paenibacillus alginolyticus]|uniref:Inositol monophosphatase n=1 Tax=Paenibacillus alginolyticus TaxID=59839 RepID=A0ABT4G7F5_9BACL|nr:inositol monophosphatase [Paenibacillus alginolyticus]MCY9692105.1 inositol monophosphatase [Paenibacillus alginolyticus]MEC0147871.1 inositol monophosphatase [Paenibacillus alginolyticus]